MIWSSAQPNYPLTSLPARCLALLLLGPLMSLPMAQAESGYSPDMLELKGGPGIPFTTDSLLGLAEGGTIEFWVAADWKDVPAQSPTLFSNVGSSGTAYTVRIAPDRKSIELQSGVSKIQADFDFSDGGLYHVAFVDFGDTTTVIVNGAIVDSFTFSIEPVATDTFWVGSAPNGSAPFRGAIAGLRIWDTPVLPDLLADYALRELEAPNAVHPDIDFLVGQSTFGSGDLLIADSETVPPEPAED